MHALGAIGAGVGSLHPTQTNPINPYSQHHTVPLHPSPGNGLPPGLPLGVSQIDYKEAWLNQFGYFFEQTPYRLSGTPEFKYSDNGYVQDLRQSADPLHLPIPPSYPHYNPNNRYASQQNNKPHPVVPDFGGDRCGCDAGTCKSRLYNGAIDICFFCYPFCEDPYVFYRILKTRQQKERLFKKLNEPQVADPGLALAAKNTFGKAPVVCQTNSQCWYAREPLSDYEAATKVKNADKTIETTSCGCKKGKCVTTRKRKNKQCLWCGDNQICHNTDAFYAMVKAIP